MNNARLNFWKQYFPFVLVAVFALFLLVELRAFIDAFLGAIILYVLVRPLMQYLIFKRKWRKWAAATIILIVSFFVVLLPILWFVYIFISKMTVVFSDSSFIIQTVNTIDDKVRQLTGIEMLSKENITALQLRAGGFITGFLGETFTLVTDLLVMYFVLYYLLVNTRTFEEMIDEYLPIRNENIVLLGNELKAQTYSNAIGAPLLAIIQGLFAWLCYVIFGVTNPFFWGMMTGLCSFIPIIGSTLIWGPAALYQMSAGTTGQGIGILLYGIFVIGTMDNVFRFVFQKKFANVHPLITVFGVIIGLQMFGVPGVIFGPVILSWFILLIRVYWKDRKMKPAL